MENKRNMITKEELLEEVAVMLKDEFLATVTKGDSICLEFLNGQKFDIKIEQV